MSSTAMDVIYLASCAVNGTVPEKARVDSMDLDAVYAFAAHHMITATIAFALESAGYKDQKSSNAIAAAMRKTALFDQAWGNIKNQLENAGIWYMPLKGAMLKNLYPKYGMREFADHDILFDASRADDVKAIMEDMGFKAEHFGASNHDCYYKRPCLNFEMHRALFGSSHEEKLYEYYKDIQRKLMGAGYEKRLSAEDFYLYMIAHEYKHFSGGGTGLRSLLDTYVYLRKNILNMEYVLTEAEKLGIAGFEKANRSLSQHLFSGDVLTEKDQETLEYILSSGTYGTITHQVENKIRKNDWSKIRYALHRFFVPFSKKNKAYTSYAATYPFFYQHRFLLPFLPFYRMFRAMKSGKFVSEIVAINQAKK